MVRKTRGFHSSFFNLSADLDRKQLYWVFDTVTTDSWREHIEDFYNTIEGLKAAPLNTLDGKEDNASEFITRVEADPESEPNLFANVFPIHPIPSHDPDKYVGPYFGNCVYCLEDYKPGELWLRFFCDHFVHYDCGRNAVSCISICFLFPAERKHTNTL